MTSATADLSLLYLDDLAAGQVYRSDAESAVVSADAIKSYAGQFDP